MTHWMFNCREISRLVSLSMDHGLAVHKRVGLWLHLAMCRYCARNRRQLLFLRKLMRQYDQHCETQADAISLPAETRKRICQKLAEEKPIPDS